LNSSDPISNTLSPLRLAGALDIYAAAGLRDELARALQQPATITIDLSDVESCDFTTIQLLCSARRSAEQAGKSFAVTSLSQGVSRACAALGLSPEVFAAKRSD